MGGATAPALGPLPVRCQVLLNRGAGCLYHIRPPWAHQARPINNLGPCLPSAPKTEAQARRSSSTKPSMITLDGSDVSVLQNPAREGGRGWRKDRTGIAFHAWGWAEFLHTHRSRRPRCSGLVPLARMRKQRAGMVGVRVYCSEPGTWSRGGASTSSRGSGAGRKGGPAGLFLSLHLSLPSVHGAQPGANLAL